MAAVLQQANIDRLFSFTEVSVIQTIDAAALQALLSQLLQGHATADAQIKAQQQEIAALKQRQHELEQVGLYATFTSLIMPAAYSHVIRQARQYLTCSCDHAD